MAVKAYQTPFERLIRCLADQSAATVTQEVSEPSKDGNEDTLIEYREERFDDKGISELEALTSTVFLTKILAAGDANAVWSLVSHGRRLAASGTYLKRCCLTPANLRM